MSISQNYPTIAPSLSLDFANVKTLDPRITYARASEARYYDGKTVSKAEENLLLYSEQFDNSYWTKTNSSITANSEIAPDGTTTADTLTVNAANGLIIRSYTGANLPHTLSIYVKRKTGTGDFQISVDNGANWDTQTVTSDWTRVDVTRTTTVANIGFRLQTSGDEVYIWGAQLEQRSSVTAYTPTTTQPITNYIPVLQTASANTARFDHDPVTGESLGLLVEEQRTNLFTYSEDFDNAAWTKSGTTILANSIISPDGTLTADKLVSSTVNEQHFLARSPATGAAHTYSIYAKAGGESVIQMFYTVHNSNAFFNLETGTVTSVTGAGATASISSIGNGWYRCTLSTTQTSHTAIWVFMRGVGVTWAGNGIDGVFIWGAQLEAGSFPTSYIKTEASQVTRAADSASMTGANFSDWYRADEGSFYAEVNTVKPTGGVAIATAYRASNGIELLALNGSAKFGSVVNGAYTANLSLGVVSANTTFKVLGAYKVDDFAGSLDGGVVATDTSGLVPLPTDSTSLFIGGYNGAPSASWALAGTIKKLSYYPQRLSNENLQALTS